jgi:hypothetical protein
MHVITFYISQILRKSQRLHRNIPQSIGPNATKNSTQNPFKTQPKLPFKFRPRNSSRWARPTPGSDAHDVQPCHPVSFDIQIPLG